VKPPDPAKIAAWRARSKPLGRGAPLVVVPERYDANRRRKGTTLRDRSPDLADYYRRVRGPLVAQLIAESRGCEAALRIPPAELPGRCHGPLTVHERRRRSDSGSLENRANLVVACLAHNSAMADCARGDVWHRHGLVVLRGDPEYQALRARPRERKAAS
jgi:hypothetical protein